MLPCTVRASDGDDVLIPTAPWKTVVLLLLLLLDGMLGEVLDDVLTPPRDGCREASMP